VTRSILARLVALLVITVAGVYYIAFDAVGVKVFNSPYTIKVDLPEPAGAGGIYSDAYVTYRGVEIGKVSSLQLHQNEVVAYLAINHGTRIPSDVTARVRELTAAAEQYMDLVPPPADPPGGGYLAPGSTIPADRTSVPVSVGTLLNTVNSLVDSLSASDLNTLSAALATGLQDAGGDLHSIIVDGDTLVTALQSAIPGTQELINDGHTVLSTFNTTSGEFAQFSANLDQLSAQVAASNSDLVALLHNGAAAGQALDPFLARTAASTVSLIDELASSTNVAYQRQGAIQALFEVLPLFSTDVASVTTGGQIRFKLDFNTADPVCPYNPTMESPTSFVALAGLTGNCTTQAPNLLQRGADKAPAPQG
jgi:phospholipid/cholesterol/gamma-HCH transport system substrate-binding protein